jgi:hypothetical protein
VGEKLVDRNILSEVKLEGKKLAGGRWNGRFFLISYYWGEKGSWAKPKNSGPFWFAINPTLKFHRNNFKNCFWTKYKNNQKIKTEEV